MTKCPILSNWSMDENGKCKRYHLCDMERHKICGAIPPEAKTPRPYSRRKKETGEGCQCKFTDTYPTKDQVVIDGEKRRVFISVCRECGKKRRIIL